MTPLTTVDKSLMQENLASIWKHITDVIRPEVSADTFRRWFKDVRMIEADEAEITLRVPNNIYQLWIETNYMALLQTSITGVLGSPRKVNFSVCPSAEHTEREEATGEESWDDEADADEAAESTGSAESTDHTVTAEAEPEAAPAKKRKAARSARPAAGAKVVMAAQPQPSAAREGRPSVVTGLNPHNTFDSFVVGTNNQFAHAAALAVAKAPARTYNPFFLYGGTGLGKTHLMHAIGYHVANSRQGAKILYITSEQFTNDFIDAIQNSKLSRFRNRYRHVDVLLIDDIQFLADKERSQEEFFHTFNTLFDGHKQIILSSDRPPSEIKNLEQRLVSRFEWGLTAELQPPDIETRLAILRKKAQSMQVKLDNSIFEFLSQRIRSNVRRLEGALTRVATFASLSGRDMSTDAVEHLLKDILQEEARPAVSIEQIQKKVAEHFDIRFADMVSKRRPANIALPRQVAMYLSRELTKASLSEIGEAFGGRDHGTVLHACKLVKKKVDAEEKMRHVVSYLDNQLNRG